MSGTPIVWKAPLVDDEKAVESVRVAARVELHGHPLSCFRDVEDALDHARTTAKAPLR